MENPDRICRFCFEKCDANFKAVEGSTYEMLNMLLVTVNLVVSDESVMCTNCSEMLQDCFVFKTTFLDVRSRRVAFTNNTNNDCIVCEFCMTLSEHCPFTIMDIEEDMPEKAMLEKYFPELDLSASRKVVICEVCRGSLVNFFSFVTMSSITEEEIKEYHLVRDVIKTDTINLNNIVQYKAEDLWKENENDVENTFSVRNGNEDLNIIKKPVTCASCHGPLKDCFHFVTNWLTVTKKIKKYCETPDMDSKGQNNSLQFTIKDTGIREGDGNSANKIKLEEEFSEDRKNPNEREIGDGRDTVKLEQIFSDDSEHDVKNVEKNNKSFMAINDQEINNEQQFLSQDMLACNKLGSVKIEVICEDKTKHKEENLVEKEDHKILLDEEIEIKTDEHDFNRFDDSITLGQLEINHENPSEVAIYKCDYCLYCTKRKSNLSRHLLTHKDPSEVTMYKCDNCFYQTKYKIVLRYHTLTHKDPSEATMYKCDNCLFQTKYKTVLRYHMRTHEDSSMYRCDFCLYQTTNKYSLKSHLIIHKNPSEVSMYKCSHCTFQAKRKPSLKRHLLMHKDPSIMAIMYKCYSCSFQTKQKHYLRKHMVVHKNPTEVTTYQCQHCSFQTKYKDCLKTHVLKHKDPSEVTMYKCGYCSFQTKRKDTLKRHALTHKNPSERTIYNCDSCSYRTKYKHHLKTHLLQHDPSKITMYKCDSCSYQTKHQGNLKDHSLIHKHTSEVTMYKCNFCLYQNKHKRRFKRHLLIHKKSGRNNVQMPPLFISET